MKHFFSAKITLTLSLLIIVLVTKAQDADELKLLLKLPAQSVLSKAILDQDYFRVRELYEKYNYSPFEYEVIPNSPQVKIAPIHRAALLNYQALVYFVKIKKLSSRQINLPFIYNEQRLTPLMLAVYTEEIDGCRILIEEGADPNIRNEKGQTALDIAVRINSPNIIKLLKGVTSTEVVKNNANEDKKELIPANTPERFELEAFEFEKQGKKARMQSMYARAMTERNKSTDLGFLANTELPLATFIYRPFDENEYKLIVPISQLFYKIGLSTNNSFEISHYLNTPQQFKTVLVNPFDELFSIQNKGFTDEHYKIKDLILTDKNYLNELLGESTEYTIFPRTPVESDHFYLPLLTQVERKMAFNEEEANQAIRFLFRYIETTEYGKSNYISRINKAIEIAKKNSIKLQLKTHWKAINICSKFDNKTQALVFLAQAKKLREKISDDMEMSLNEIIYNTLLNQYTESEKKIAILANALNNCGEIESVSKESLKFQILALLSDAYWDNDQYEKAVENYQILLEQFPVKYHPFTLLTCNKIAQCFQKLNNFEEFERYNQKTNQIYEQLKIVFSNYINGETKITTKRKRIIEYLNGYCAKTQTFFGEVLLRTTSMFSKIILNEAEVKDRIITLENEGTQNDYLRQIINDGQKLELEGKTKEALGLYNQTLGKLKKLDKHPSNGLRLASRYYILSAKTDKNQRDEDSLASIQKLTLEEWGIYSQVYSDVILDILSYYEETNQLEKLYIYAKHLQELLQKRQEALAAFMLNDYEYETFIRLHSECINKLLSICVKNYPRKVDFSNVLGNYLISAKGLHLKGQRIARDQFQIGADDKLQYYIHMVRLNYPNFVKKQFSDDSLHKMEEIAKKKVNAYFSKQGREKLYDTWTIEKAENERFVGHPVMGDYNIKSRDSYLAIEAELIDSVAQYVNQLTKLTAKDVLNNLSSSKVIIDFFSFKSEDKERYIALMYNKQKSSPIIIELPQIDELLTQIKSLNKSESIEQLYATNDIYDSIWRPLIPFLNGINEISLISSSFLNNVSFNAIRNSNNVFISEMYHIKYYSSIINIFDSTEQIFNIPDTNIDLWGGIYYDKKPSRVSINEDEKLAMRGSKVISSRGESWNYLIGAESEINSIQQILKTVNNDRIKSFTKTNASEDLFKKRYMVDFQPNILHIATHGFYDKFKIRPNILDNDNDLDISHTMLNSALVMAGANIKKTEEDGTEDGILTALEISKLNIGAKLVVLSACETALGEQRNEEGVFGLQRAFKLAGADFLLMTLWKIPDKQTFEMMQIFYSNLAKKVSIEESFSIAQNEMKKKYSPFYWAGFILVN